MKKLRTLTATLVALALVLTLSVSALADMSIFTLDGSYEAGRFTDVDETAWYGYYKQGSVATAYELGLMSGNSSTTFNPDGKLRLSEAVTIAARLRSIYEGDGKIFEKTSPWYKTYVDYAEDMGIIPEVWMDRRETDYALRREMAYIFSADNYFSLVTAVDTAENIQDSSFACTAESHDNCKFTLVNGKCYTISGSYSYLTHFISFINILEFYKVFCHSFTSNSSLLTFHFYQATLMLF